MLLSLCSFVSFVRAGIGVSMLATSVASAREFMKATSQVPRKTLDTKGVDDPDLPRDCEDLNFEDSSTWNCGRTPPNSPAGDGGGIKLAKVRRFGSPCTSASFVPSDDEDSAPECGSRCVVLDEPDCFERARALALSPHAPGIILSPRLHESEYIDACTTVRAQSFECYMLLLKFSLKLCAHIASRAPADDRMCRAVIWPEAFSPFLQASIDAYHNLIYVYEQSLAGVKASSLGIMIEPALHDQGDVVPSKVTSIPCSDCRIDADLCKADCCSCGTSLVRVPAGLDMYSSHVPHVVWLAERMLHLKNVISECLISFDGHV